MSPHSMRDRLRANAEGRLHRQQYIDLLMQPLTAGLLLAVPVLLVLGARASLLVVSPVWRLILIAVVIYVLLRTTLQAVRFARLPVRSAVLRATGFVPARFWQTPPLETDDGALLRFRQRLAPLPRLRPGARYRVYFLQAGDDYILLSLEALPDGEA